MKFGNLTKTTIRNKFGKTKNQKRKIHIKIYAQFIQKCHTMEFISKSSKKEFMEKYKKEKLWKDVDFLAFSTPQYIDGVFHSPKEP